ncbi:hypothetical protein WMY93_016564 [Mugilogobius chulae]|uniref:Glycoprotein endo-alpha-1,2-mannosidase n=1 Tax=Mugilogobius chulae TaxID=88201 RepID=A0AAW0NVZ0_9GOBI
MVRFRRKTCIPVLAVLFLVLVVSVVLRNLPPEDSSPVSLVQPAETDQRDNMAHVKTTPMPLPVRPDRDPQLEETLRRFPPPNYYVHAFYYPWYGNPKHDGKYVHWDHPQLPHWDAKVAQGYPQGRHVPPDDIGANYYPALGPYSSKDPAVVENHMQQLRMAAIAIQRTDEVNMFTNVKYIIEKYGDHPAFFKYRTTNGKLLPLFYIYDSYLMNSEQWAKLLKHTTSGSIRDTPYDAIFVALLVEETHKREILTAGFDGLYTYFATNGFSYGSTLKNWAKIRAFCEDNGLVFIPSVGPGYIDTSIRPWNFKNTRNRINGKYYETA